MTYLGFGTFCLWSSSFALYIPEPTINTILILPNIINHVLGHLIYCGLIGQVLIGVAFGTPATKWPDKGTEQVIVQLGYLGLILVYWGGLNINFKSPNINFKNLKANAGFSVLVALTGISLPSAFAHCLRNLASATPLQAFAAGKALCSTESGRNVDERGYDG